MHLDGRLRLARGGMFNNYAIVQGVDHIVPVDMYLPGCPPRPEMLIDAILKLHDKIMDEPLGAKRAARARPRRGRRRRPTDAAGAMPSTVPRRQGSRRADEEAAAEGRAGAARASSSATATPSLLPRSDGQRKPAMTGPGDRSRRDAGVGAQRRRRARQGMFGVSGTGDTSGFGGLVAPSPAARRAALDRAALRRLLRRGRRRADRGRTGGLRRRGRAGASSTAARSPSTSRREHLPSLPRRCATTTALRFELCSSVSGVDYLGADGARRAARRLPPDLDDLPPPDPARGRGHRRGPARARRVTGVYPTADWHERETWDMFGIVFDGHPA